MENPAYNSHPIFAHPFFHTEKFQAFKQQLSERVRHINNPIEDQVRRALPHLTAVMDSKLQAVLIGQAELKQKVDVVDSKLDRQDARNDLAFQTSQRSVAGALINSGLSLLNKTPHVLTPGILSPSHESPPMNPFPISAVDSLPSSSLSLPSLNPQTQEVLLKWPTQSRALKTVQEVWNEYIHGFPGEMSVQRTSNTFQDAKY
jgi:hypothetical protein